MKKANTDFVDLIRRVFDASGVEIKGSLVVARRFVLWEHCSEDGQKKAIGGINHRTARRSPSRSLSRA